MKVHKLALFFPMASDDELNQMADDIKKRGLKNKIIVLGDQILDGRNRFEACKRAGIEPTFMEYKGNDPLNDVISWNLHRRHLTTSQRSALAVELEPMYAAEAKKRESAGGGDQKSGRANLPHPIENKGRARDQAAAVVKVSGRGVSDAKAVKEKAPELFEKVKTGEKTVHEALKEIKQKEVKVIREQKSQALPTDVFDVIYADPPWQYNNSGFEMSAESKYPTMATEEIEGIKIKTADNSVLFLWATNPLLEDALRIMTAWGFEYKTNMVWIKEKHTAGFYVFGQHELLLIGTRGSFLPTGEKPKSIISGENKIHSKKPDLYGTIESMYPNLKYLELFSRNEPRQGWVKWGKEIGKYES